MNIFILSKNPVKAAQMQCDRHTIKMILESCQLLCNAFPQESVPYKRTHYNHPCAVWVRESRENYLWLLRHALALCQEYSMRYSKRHKTQSVLENLPYPDHLPDIGLTEFAQCIPEEYKNLDAVLAYRAYYKFKRETIQFCYTNRAVPEWLL